MKVDKRKNNSVKNNTVDTVEEKSQAEIAENLELNAISIDPFTNRAQGIASSILGSAEIEMYKKKNFAFEYKDQDSSEGNLFYNIVITDTQKTEGEKNEVARICILSSVEGNVELNENFNNLYWKIKSAIYAYIVDKLLNYFDREQNAGAEAAKPNKYLEKAAAMRKQAA